MKTAIILHGKPSKDEYYDSNFPSASNYCWIPWLQKQLLINGILAQTPELPKPYEPVYEKWLKVFEQFNIDENTILIGHSCGAGFLVRWLTENNIRVGKVILVAPFLDPFRDEVKSDFFDFEIKKGLSKQTRELCIFYSTDDERSVTESVNQIISADKEVKIKQFTNKGHFTLESMKTDKFPELIDYLLK
jgi:predicted alpha/beta hydrolase family esterase